MYYRLNYWFINFLCERHNEVMLSIQTREVSEMLSSVYSFLVGPEIYRK